VSLVQEGKLRFNDPVSKYVVCVPNGDDITINDLLKMRSGLFAMKPTPEPSAQEVLAGLVERVTYHNAENGFCVLRAKARGHRDVVTVVGHSATIAAGEWITASGEWVNDRTHGQQFKAKFPVLGLDQRPGSPCHQSHPSRDAASRRRRACDRPSQGRPPNAP